MLLVSLNFTRLFSVIGRAGVSNAILLRFQTIKSVIITVGTEFQIFPFPLLREEKVKAVTGRSEQARDKALEPRLDSHGCAEMRGAQRCEEEEEFDFSSPSTH